MFTRFAALALALGMISFCGVASTGAGEPPADNGFESAVDQLALEPTDEESTARLAARRVLNYRRGESSDAQQPPPQSHRRVAAPNRESLDGDAANDALTAPSGLEIDPKLLPLRDRVRRVLSMFHQRHLNTQDHNPWEIMHALVSYGVHTNIRRGGPRGEVVNAASYLCWNGPCHGITLLEDRDGRVNARKGPYVQGHYGQLLALLAQAHVKRTYPLRVGKNSYTLEDLIETEKLTCRTGEELTFKLISLAHYLDSDAEWESEDGRTWSIEKLIAEEIEQPILRTAACGGTHRLMGLSYAVRKRKKQGGTIDGQWVRAEKYTEDYRNYAFRLQNRDGSFSTKWFERRQAEQDIDRRVKTTGHILEWIVYSVDEEQLFDPRIVKAVNYLASTMERGGIRRTWEPGPLGHAIHALRIYDRRAFSGDGADASRRVASQPEREHAVQNQSPSDAGNEERVAQTPPSAEQQHRMLLNRSRQRSRYRRGPADDERPAAPVAEVDSSTTDEVADPIEPSASEDAVYGPNPPGEAPQDDDADGAFPAFGPALGNPQ